MAVNVKKKLSAKLCTYIDDRELDEEISEKIKTLIDQGADVNFRDPNFDGNTPLHIAVGRNDRKCVEFIIKLDVDLEVKNEDGETAFDFAEKNENSEVLRILETVSLKTSSVFHSINPKYIFEIKTADCFKNLNSRSITKIVKLNKLPSLDEVFEILGSKEFKDFVSGSPALFGLDLEICCKDLDLVLMANVEKKLPIERSWIIYIKFGENNQKIFFKEAKKMAAPLRKIDNLTFDDFSYSIKKECNIEILLQGILQNLLGKHNGSIYGAKLSDEALSKSSLMTAAENDGLCLRFLLAFFDSPTEIEEEETPLPAKRRKLMQKDNEINSKTLLDAIEMNNFELVENLLKSGMSGNLAFCDIAWELKHFQCLEKLMKADSPFPKTFDPSVYNFSCFNELNSFHEDIKSGSMEKVEFFVVSNPKMKFAYDLTNKTALSVALEAKQLEIYAYLRSRGFSHGIDKNFTKNLEKLTYEEKKVIQKENLKYFKSSDNSHLFYILSKTRIAFNPGNYEKDFKIVNKMLEELNEIVEIQPILKAVEHVDVQITFDFNQRGVHGMIPAKPKNEHGTCFYDTGYVFVGAKDHEKRYDEIIGTLAHELSHYVMNLIYRNEAKPFFPGGFEKEQRYNRIIKNLKTYFSVNQQTIISIFRDIFTLYDKNVWPNELIVCVPEILAKYRNDRGKVEKILDYAGDLFHFFYETTLEDIKNVSFEIQPKAAIRELNDLFGTLHEVWISKISFKKKEFDIVSDSNLRLIASDAPTFSMAMILEAFNELYREACECHVIFAKIGALNKVLLEKIKKAMNSSVKPHLVVNVTDGREKDLEMLSTYLTNQKLGERIILVSTIDESEKLQDIFVEPEFLPHEWEDIDFETRELLLDRSINFQGHYVQLLKILSEYSEALNVIKLQNLVEDFSLKIGESLENSNRKFTVPRKFLCQTISDRERSKYMADRSFQGENRNHKIFAEKNIEELLEKSEKMKKMLISDLAGTGKTVMLKEIAVKLKQKHPERWVGFIDLKDFICSFKKIQTEESLSFSNSMIQLFYQNMNKFDKAVFEELYENGRTVLLFDSFDEISPVYKDVVMKFIESFEIKKGNQLWVTTRSHLENELLNAMEATLVKMENLSKKEQIELLIKSWEKENFETKDINQENLAKKLINQLENLLSTNSGFVGLPILIEMIGKTYKDQKFDKITKLRFFDIYENFTKNIFSNWREGGEVSKMEQNDHDMETGLKNVMEVHQKMAIDYIFENEFADSEDEIDEKWTHEKISRVGIITMNENSSKFLHETFAEYFVARYITNIMKKKKKSDKLTTILLKTIKENKFQVIRSFLNEYFEIAFLTESFKIELKSAIEHRVNNKECKYLLKNLVKEGHKNIFTALNLGNLEKSVLVEILEERSLGENIFFQAARSPVSIIHQLFEYFEIVTNKTEVKGRVLKMFKEKDDHGYNLILHFFQFGRSLEVFENLCSVLKDIADKEEIKNIVLEKRIRGKNLLNFFVTCRYSIVYMLKIWSFLRTCLDSTEFFMLLTEKNDDKRGNALHLAFCDGNQDSIKNLFDIMKKFSVDQQKLLLESENHEGSNFLHESLFMGNQNNLKSLFEIIKNFPVEDQKLLLESVNNKGSNSLHISLAKGNQEIVKNLFEIIKKLPSDQQKFLLESENHEGSNFLHLSLSKGNQENVKNLFEIIMKFPIEQQKLFLESENNKGCNFLHASLSKGNQDILVHLLEIIKKLPNQQQEVLLESKNDEGCNFLHASLSKGNQEILQKLFEIIMKFPIEQQKLLLESKNDEGCNFLHVSFSKRNPKIVQTLFEIIKKFPIEQQKLLVESENNDGYSFLHVSLSMGDQYVAQNIFEIIRKLPVDQQKFLLEPKINECHNLLHVAISNENQEVAQNLFEIIKKLPVKQQKLLLEYENNEGFNVLFVSVCSKNFSTIFDHVRNCLTKDEIKKLLQKKTNKNQNIFSIAYENKDPNIYTKLFNCIKSVTSEDEVKEIVLEMFKEKDDFGDNVICRFRHSVNLFKDFSSILNKVGSQEEIANWFEEK